MQEKQLVESVKKNNNISRDITGILDIIICLLLFISSIYKGAFYKADFLFPNVVISFVGIIYLVYKIVKELVSKKDYKPKSKIRILLDFFMLVLPFTYILPIMFKTYVSLPDSIFEMLRYVNMTTIYFIARNSKNQQVYFNVFIIISISQMILGIDQVTTRSFENFLNDLSTGYLPDKQRLSATLQYANITGIVIGIGVIYCFNKINDILSTNAKTKYIKLITCIFFVLLGISCIVLTESRVATLTIVVALLLDSIFSFEHVNRKTSIYKMLLIIYSILCSGLVEKFVVQSHKLRIYLVTFLLAIVFAVLYEILNILRIIIKDKIVKNGKICKYNKLIKVALIVLGVSLVCVVITIPKNIVLEKIKEGENITISRNIYKFKEGENTIKFNVDSLQPDTRYTVYIDGVVDGYVVNRLATYNYYDNTSGNFKSKITIPENVQSLNINIQIQKGKLKFEDFKINNNKINLSYFFIPDELAQKLQDTFYGVYGDKLRLTYVKDTFKLLKNSPVIGVGGEGFKHTYGSVQETGYISSEAHSAILQALVEVGIIGTSILASIILLSLCLIIKLIIRLKKLSKEDKNNVIVCVCVYLAVLSVVVFDLAFSYAFMIYLFGVITAILVKDYMYVVGKYEAREKHKSIIDWGYVKIIVLSISTVTLTCMLYFSINAYRASLVKIPNKGEDLTAAEIAENIAYLELKNSQDKYDIDYILELNEEYEKYKEKLTDAIISASNDKKLQEELKEEQVKIIINIKNNADKMLDYEYYDKFVLRDVANVYIDNYVSFAEIYKEQFSNIEVSYSFYLNYVLKLADRIVKINPHSKKAQEIYINMCNRYIQELKSDNIYLQSDAINNIILEFESKIR